MLTLNELQKYTFLATETELKVMQIVCVFYNIDDAESFVNSRAVEYKNARLLCMVFMYNELGLSKRHISKIFAKHRTTVLHIINLANELLYIVKDSRILLDYKAIKEKYDELDNIESDNIANRLAYAEVEIEVLSRQVFELMKKIDNKNNGSGV